MTVIKQTYNMDSKIDIHKDVKANIIKNMTSVIDLCTKIKNKYQHYNIEYEADNITSNIIRLRYCVNLINDSIILHCNSEIAKLGMELLTEVLDGKAKIKEANSRLSMVAATSNLIWRS